MSSKPAASDEADSPASSGETRFVRRVIVALALIAVAAALWQLRGLLLLAFGSVVVATLFRALADPIRHKTGMPDWAALTITVLAILTALVAAGIAFGSEAVTQGKALMGYLPQAWEGLQQRLAGMGLGGLAESMPQPGQAFTKLTNFALSLGGALATTLLLLAGAVYFAAQPKLYRKGLVLLVPRAKRPLVDEALGDSGRALGMWLRGQLITMLTVGVLTGLGLWAIGVPSALVLGLLAGLLDFVPFVGPIVAAIPALLVAFNESGQMALWTLILYVVVQQIEGSFLYPIVQRYAVGTPPALLLFAIVAAGTLFGIPGVILGAPLTVVCYVLVKRLYVREALHTQTDVPGEEEGADDKHSDEKESAVV